MTRIVTSAFSLIWNMGVTDKVRPEETKHIRLLNVGALCYGLNSLAWLSLNFIEGFVFGWIPVLQLLGIVCAAIVFVLQYRHRYTLARAFMFLCFYLLATINYVMSGPAVQDHYFIVIGIAYSFLVVPRSEGILLLAYVSIGLLCYLLIHFLYRHVTPLSLLTGDALQSHNTILVHNVLFLVVVLMAAGRIFMSKTEESLEKERSKLAEMTALLRKMFGRYLSAEVMNAIIADPAGLELGGEKRPVTIMMTDLRGFTALSERLEPDQVVRMLNAYFEVMIDVVLKYNGTINEIIGDALLVVFGAPQDMPHRTEAAVACAIEMQNAMNGVNQSNRDEGLPELEMGIGLNETEAVVGNIGSQERIKYAVVGSGVNLTGRIESYSTGGQILVSESIRKKLGDVLRIDGFREVQPKGAQDPILIYQVGGIAGRYNQTLVSEEQGLMERIRQIPVVGNIVGGKDVGATTLRGSILRLSRKEAVATLNPNPSPMGDLKLNLVDVDEELGRRDFFGKVLETRDPAPGECRIRFTGVPLEVKAYFQSHLQHARETALD